MLVRAGDRKTAFRQTGKTLTENTAEMFYAVASRKTVLTGFLVIASK